MKLKKRCITLLEVVISLFLIAILLTTLFNSFSQLILIEKKFEEAKKEVFAQQHVHIRLNQIFSQIAPLMLHKKRGSSLYTQLLEGEKYPSLVTIFDNNIDPNPAFSGFVLSKLYIDENKNFCLVIWPLSCEDTSNYKKEILIKKVKSVDFEFYTKKEDNLIEKSSVWEKKREDLPLILKVVINKELEYPFFLLSPRSVITY